MIELTMTQLRGLIFALALPALLASIGAYLLGRWAGRRDALEDDPAWDAWRNMITLATFGAVTYHDCCEHCEHLDGEPYPYAHDRPCPHGCNGPRQEQEEQPPLGQLIRIPVNRQGGPPPRPNVVWQPSPAAERATDFIDRITTETDRYITEEISRG